MSALWFVYDDDHNMMFYLSEDTARLVARRRMQKQLDHALSNGEWLESIDSLCWGCIHGKTVAIDVSEDTPDGTIDAVDYQLQEERE